jgi:hypothetical protein
MARKRLTARMEEARGRRAVEDNTPYPGTVNQEGRKFKRRDEYDIDWETTNHPFPDMRHEWKGDSRDEIGFGIPEGNPPTVASIRVAANKAVRIAVLLLGDKVGDEVLEAQARDLMGMDGEAMDRTLQRFADTQELYAEAETTEASEEEPKKVEAEEGKTEETTEASEEEPKKAEDEAKDEEPKKAEEAAEASDESKDDEPKKAEDEDEKADEDKDEDDGEKEASDESKDEEPKKADEEPKKAEDDEDGDDKDDDGDDEDGDKEASEEPKKAEEEPAPKKSTEFDIELTSASADEVDEDPEADARLAEALGMGENDAKQGRGVEAAEQPQKAGIKKLGGQPRVASDGDGEADISSIWRTAPDVNEVWQ